MARVAFANLSEYATGYSEGMRRPTHGEHCAQGGAAACAACYRRNGSGGVKADLRDRVRYDAGTRPVCDDCLLPGAWDLPTGHPMRLEVGHRLPLALGGSSSSVNLCVQHAYCNATDGDRDMRAYIPRRTTDLPPLSRAVRAWVNTARGLPTPVLPTLDEVREARAARVFWDESGACYGLPF